MLDLRNLDNQADEYLPALKRVGLLLENLTFFNDPQGQKATAYFPHLAATWAHPQADPEVRCDLCSEQALARTRDEVLRYLAALDVTQPVLRGVQCPICGSFLAGPSTDKAPVWSSSFQTPPCQSLKLEIGCEGATLSEGAALWHWQQRIALKLIVRGDAFARLGRGSRLRLLDGEKVIHEHTFDRDPTRDSPKNGLYRAVSVETTLAPDQPHTLRAELFAVGVTVPVLLAEARLTVRPAPIRVVYSALAQRGRDASVMRLSIQDQDRELGLPEALAHQVSVGDRATVALQGERSEIRARASHRWYGLVGTLKGEEIERTLRLGTGARSPVVQIERHRPAPTEAWAFEVTDPSSGARPKGDSDDTTLYLGYRLNPGSRILVRVAPSAPAPGLVPESLLRAGLLTHEEEVVVSPDGSAHFRAFERAFVLIGQRRLEVRVQVDQVSADTERLAPPAPFQPEGRGAYLMEPMVVWLQEERWSSALVRVVVRGSSGADEPVDIREIEECNGILAAVQAQGQIRLSALSAGQHIPAGQHRLVVRCRIDRVDTRIPVLVEVRPAAPVRLLPNSRDGGITPCFGYPLPADPSGHFNLHGTLSAGERDAVRASFSADQRKWLASRMEELSGESLGRLVLDQLGIRREQASSAHGPVLFRVVAGGQPEADPPPASSVVKTESGKEYRLIADASPWRREREGGEREAWVSEAVVASQDPGERGNAPAGAIRVPPLGYEWLGVSNPAGLASAGDGVDDAKLRAFARLHPVVAEFPWESVPAPRSQLVVGQDSVVPIVLANTLPGRVELRFHASLHGRVSVLAIAPWDYVRQLGFLANHRTLADRSAALPPAPHPAARETTPSIGIEGHAATVVLLRIRLEKPLAVHDTNIDIIWLDVPGALPLKIEIPILYAKGEPVLQRSVGPVGLDVGSFSNKAVYQHQDEAGLHRRAVHCVQWSQNSVNVRPAETDTRDLFPSRLTVLGLSEHPRYPAYALPRYHVAGLAAVRLDNAYDGGATRSSKSRVSLTGRKAPGVERLRLPRDAEMTREVLLAALRGDARPQVVDLPLLVEVSVLFEVLCSHLTESLLESLPTMPRAVEAARPTTLSPHDIWLYHHLLGSAFERAVRARLLQDPGLAAWTEVLEAIGELLPCEVTGLEQLPGWVGEALDARFRGAPPGERDYKQEWISSATRDLSAAGGDPSARATFWFCASLAALAPPRCLDGWVEPGLMDGSRVLNAALAWLGEQAHLLHQPTLKRFAGWVAARVPGLDCATDEPTASIAGVVAATLSDQAGDPGLRAVLTSLGATATNGRNQRWLSLDFGAGTNDVELVEVRSRGEDDCGQELMEIRPLRETHSHYAGIFATNIMYWLLMVLGKMRRDGVGGGALIRNDRLRDLAQRGGNAPRPGLDANVLGGYAVEPAGDIDPINDPGGYGLMGFGMIDRAEDGAEAAAPEPEVAARQVNPGPREPADEALVTWFQSVQDFLYDAPELKGRGPDALDSVRRAALEVLRTLLPDLPTADRSTRNAFWDLAESVKLRVCDRGRDSQLEMLFEEYRRWVMPGYEATFQRVAAMLRPAERTSETDEGRLVAVLSGRAAQDPVMIEVARRFAEEHGFPLLHLGDGHGEDWQEGNYAFFAGWPGFHPVALGLLAREGMMLESNLQIGFGESLLSRARVGLRVRVGPRNAVLFDREHLLSEPKPATELPGRPPLAVQVFVDVLDDRLSRPGAPEWSAQDQMAIFLNQTRRWWRSDTSMAGQDVAMKGDLEADDSFLPYQNAGAARFWVLIGADRMLRVYLELTVRHLGEVEHWITAVVFDTLRSHSLRAPFEDDDGPFWRP